jgi:hypothetical protein
MGDDWHGFEDRGDDFLHRDHPYARDLDVFGASSVYQWLSVARSWHGRHRLAALLGGAGGGADEIHARQEAVEELARDPEFRQALEVAGRSNPCGGDPAELCAWANGSPRWPLPQALSAVVGWLPALALVGLVGELAWSETAYFAGAILALQLLVFLGTRSRCLRLFTECRTR